jgi:hypothetical protein
MRCAGTSQFAAVKSFAVAPAGIASSAVEATAAIDSSHPAGHAQQAEVDPAREGELITPLHRRDRELG